MADSGESTATFGCRSDSTTAGACPAAEADVSISDIEVAPEMNTDPENESGQLSKMGDPKASKGSLLVPKVDRAPHDGFPPLMPPTSLDP